MTAAQNTRLKTELMETRRLIELVVRAAEIKLQNSLALYNVALAELEAAIANSA